eukprot:Mrub_05168.p1 GENE.Mrub_05168~~Mrub_05168.p1  ORF type:complete len:362 (+),score=102.07 Mrub_05168:87-1088(+)
MQIDNLSLIEKESIKQSKYTSELMNKIEEMDYIINEKEKKINYLNENYDLFKSNSKRDTDLLKKKIFDIETKLKTTISEKNIEYDKYLVQENSDLKDQIEELKRKHYESNKIIENKQNEIENYRLKIGDYENNLKLALNNESEQAREAETKRQISEALKLKIEKAIDRESSLLKKVEELQSSFGNSSEREMTLVRQVRELKIEREETVKRENSLNAKIDKLQDSESILRKQMDHALGHVSSLRKQLAESEAKVQQIHEERACNYSINSGDYQKIGMLEKKNQALMAEVEKLKQLSSKAKGSGDKSPMKGGKMDSLSRATNILSFGSSDMYNMW